MMSGYEESIIRYFCEGFSYMEMIELLNRSHNIAISLSTLKRFLRNNDLRRRPLPHLSCSAEQLKNAIENQLNSSAAQLGYRRMHKVLLNQGLLCRRTDVRLMLKDLDPENVDLRRKRRLRRRKYVNPGPNHTWHIDGHDNSWLH